MTYVWQILFRNSICYQAIGDHLALIGSTQGGGYTIFVRAGLLSGCLLVNGSYRAPSVSGSGLSGWHYVTLTFDGRYTKLYVDGIEEAVVDAGGTYSITYNATNSIMIHAEASGADAPEFGRRWEGKVGSTEIYNQALSVAEVLENNNATKTRFGK